MLPESAAGAPWVEEVHVHGADAGEALAVKEGEVEAAPTGSARSHGGPDVVVVPQTRPCRAADTRTCEVVGFVSRRDGKESGGGAERALRRPKPRQALRTRRRVSRAGPRGPGRTPGARASAHPDLHRFRASGRGVNAQRGGGNRPFRKTVRSAPHLRSFSVQIVSFKTSF